MALPKCSNKSFLHKASVKTVKGTWTPISEISLSLPISIVLPENEICQVFFWTLRQRGLLFPEESIQSQWFLYFLYSYYDKVDCAEGMLGPAPTRFTLVLLLFSERLSVLAESSLGADKSSWGWEARVHSLIKKTVPILLSCPPKLSSPSHGIQLNGGSAACGAPETVSLLRRALGISWTSHWTPLLPPGITFLI